MASAGILAIIQLWETLTRIPSFTQNTLFDPFFISRPSRVRRCGCGNGCKLWPRSVWPHLWLTLQATLVGLVVGVGSGFIVGMTLSRSRFLANINPFIVAFNSMPRIAFVPLVAMLFGLGLASKVVTSWFVVFFLVFFNTYKGGRSVERELVDFCRTLGGSPRQILWRVGGAGRGLDVRRLAERHQLALIGVVLAEFSGPPPAWGIS